MSNWAWACEQLLKGEKVSNKETMRANGYAFISNDCALMYHDDEVEEIAEIDMKDLQSIDWELYKEPKKWTKEQREYAKALLVIGGTHLACDKDDNVWCYTQRPYKGTYMWHSAGELVLARKSVMNDLFRNDIHWEDKEPTRLQDIVDSEKESE